MSEPTAAPRRVFLTGGTGMLGSHVAALVRRRGGEVRALHGPRSDTSFLRALGCELVEGDVRHLEGLTAAACGCDAVVHAAAVIYGGRSLEAVREVNVLGTERVLRAAALAGIRRAVHFSSIAVHGDPRGRPDEDSPLHAPLADAELYARSKRASETVAHELAPALGMAIAILRPAAVYGERDRLFTPGLARVFRFPIQFVLGNGRGAIPAVYAGNVADAALALLAAADGGNGPARGGARVYDLAEDHPVTQLDLYRALARALDLPFRPVPLPGPLVLAGSRVGQALGVKVANAPELPLHRAARFSLGPNPFGSRRLREELGWSPPVPLAEALARTARWADEARAELGLPARRR